jgi:hypothetical protein
MANAQDAITRDPSEAGIGRKSRRANPMSGFGYPMYRFRNVESTAKAGARALT